MHPVSLVGRGIRFCTTTLAVFACFVALPGAAHAQITPSRPDLTLKLPELEVYQIRPQADPVRAGGNVVIAIGTRNNGTAPGTLAYAIGPKDRSAIWATGTGTTLQPGKLHIGGIRMTYAQAYNFFRGVMGANNPGGMQTVCFGVFLLREDAKTHFTDRNNPNHQKEHCLRFEFPIM